MPIYRQLFHTGRDKTYSAEARDLGAKLAAIVAPFAAELPRARLFDHAALDAAIEKSIFRVDSTGQWWAKVAGERIGTNASGDPVKIPKTIQVPTPEALCPVPQRVGVDISTFGADPMRGPLG